jgi:hypothetical protein
LIVPVGSHGCGSGLRGSLTPLRFAAHVVCGCELGSPFLAKPIQMSFAGLGNPPQSPPARAGHCALVGGYMRRKKQAPVGRMSRALKRPWHLSTAAFAGRCWSHFIHRRLRVVPYGLPGYRRLRRAPPQHRCCPGAIRPGSSAASGKTLQAQGNTPCAPRGGLCGCLAVRQTSSKPPGVPTGWGRLRAEPPGRASSWGA